MQDLLSILFYIRKSKAKDLELGTIYLRITYSGERAELSTFLKVSLEKWNAKANKLMGSSPTAKEVNRNLDMIKKNVYRAYQEMMDKQQDISALKLRNRYLGKDDSRKDILNVFDEHNSRMAKLVGKDYTARTLQRYKTTKSHVSNFNKATYSSIDYLVKDIDVKYINHFIYYLKTTVDLSHNSAMKYLSYFKKIIRICHANGWIEKDPFYNFKLRTHEIEKEFLTKQELNKLIDKELSNQRLEQVRDVFIFSCFTGLAYIDVTKLTHDDIILGIDGEQWIKVKRTKTGTISNIPLLPAARNIIAKYYSKKQQGSPLLPMSSNQKTNNYLKEIANLCEINKNLTFHIARHTFATTVTLSNGVPIESVSKMLGHKSLKTTQHYAKIVDRKLSDDVQKLKKVFNEKVNFKDTKSF
ncbi:site-specific integrase [Galbibacter sp. BG1]|uniref:site-specific integrase n=1 Tax=Galbibacter sp. BG1 TaxID=1170699 RepID=UPI0015BD7994|nr:site-specific integrase [Galbibacter sp. BG1]QLE01500.1 site-specific integrase [Galbibacter sp. BG1]